MLVILFFLASISFCFYFFIHFKHRSLTMVSWLPAKSVPSNVIRLGIQILTVALNTSYFSSESNRGFMGFFITFKCFNKGNYKL